MRRRIGFVVFASAASLAIALPSAASALTKTVYAGPPGRPPPKSLSKAFVQKYAPDINDYFLHRVTINQGDAIKFIIHGFHTIDLPGPSGKDLPLIVPGPTVTGVKDAAGNPFWFDGKVPSLGFNHQLLGASGANTYNGAKRIESGLPLGPSKPLKVSFTKPGTYKYFCDVHPGMVGYVVVLAKGKKIPSAKQDAATLGRQAERAVRTAKKLAHAKVAAARVSLGEAGAGGVELYAMFPASLSVKAGAVVTFSMARRSRDIHTATFGPRNYLMGLVKGFNSPVFPPQGTYPSSPAGITLGGSASHGNGFANTGLLDEDPATPLPASYEIKFTKRGVYPFVCLIHPFMRGTIVVK